jgi:hypothetical protein
MLRKFLPRETIGPQFYSYYLANFYSLWSNVSLVNLHFFPFLQFSFPNVKACILTFLQNSIFLGCKGGCDGIDIGSLHVLVVEHHDDLFS